jgi:hypothetical protein
MLTRKEMISTLNVLLATVDNIQESFPQRQGRPHERLNIIRDQLALLALDLGLPIQPIKEEKKSDERPASGDQGETPQTG